MSPFPVGSCITYILVYRLIVMVAGNDLKGKWPIPGKGVKVFVGSCVYQALVLPLLPQRALVRDLSGDLTLL